MNSDSETNQIIAYEISRPEHIPIRPASIFRTWMDETASRFAYRCLPLVLANQFGWTLGSPCSFSASWTGGEEPDDVLLVFDEVPPESMVSSLFGNGILTFNMPCVFRTPEGVNLWIKGPSNTPKDSVYPLEGIVESDWTSATFTMNWKFTRPNQLVRFERGEPFCTIVPTPRGLIESLDPVCVPITSNPHVNDAFTKWSQDRNHFHEQVASGESEALKVGWQKDYFKGRDPGTDSFSNHQTRIVAKPFRMEGFPPETDSGTE